MNQAPSGTVSLVFTDIQGSTALWERYGNDFQTILDLHHQVIRACIANCCGYEVKTEGDAFMVAFSEAESAVQFALKAQIELKEADWPSMFIDDSLPIEAARSSDDEHFRGLRVRMGIHIGKPTSTLDPTTGRMDYLGRMVNKTGRLMRAAHGGQVLISSRAWNRAKGAIRDDYVEVSDLGMHALRGISGTDVIYQLNPKSLSGRRFPPIHTERIQSTNIAADGERLVGREDELIALDGHLQNGARLVTLLGPPGVGRRSLAAHFGKERTEQFRGGVWFCDLADAVDQVDFCGTIADVLDIHLTPGDPITHLGNALLGRGRILLICEHADTLIEKLQSAFQAWLSRAPELRIIVTAREPLGLESEQLMPLDPLPPPKPNATQDEVDSNPAVAILRMASDQPKAPLSNLHALSRMLDGIPMALKATGARAKSRSWPAIQDDLEQKLLPESGRPPSRAQIAVVALASAIDELTPELQNALYGLSVFCGGFSLIAAASVIGEEAEKHIEALVDMALIRSVDCGRWAFPPLIQDVAVERLCESGQLRDFEKRHGGWFARMGRPGALDKIHHRNGMTNLAMLRRNRDNIRAAAVRAMDRDDGTIAGPAAAAWITVLQWAGPPLSSLPVANRALSMSNLNAEDRVTLLRLRSLCHHAAGHHTEATSDLNQAKTIAKTGLSQGRIWLDIGLQWCDQGKSVVSLDALETALRLFTEESHEDAQGRTLSAMANLSASSGALTHSRRLYLTALNIHRRVENRGAEARALSNLAIVSTIEGRYAEARELFRDALSIQREMGDRRAEAVVHGNLGDLFLETKDFETARQHLELAISFARSVGDRLIEGCFTGTLGEVKGREGHLAQARSLMARSERLLREVGDGFELVRLICRRGQIERLGRYPERAWTCLEQAEKLHQSLGLEKTSKPHQAIVELSAQLAGD